MFNLFFNEYITLLILCFISILLAFIIFGASFFIAYQNPDLEKLSMYECGFDPYEDGRNFFDIQFFIIALLFIIFDLETMFLFPWSVSLGQLNLISFYSMLDFFFELLVGFFYVWFLGVLDWS
jgi:NADH-quinone oxidoreductase subunit A